MVEGPDWGVDHYCKGKQWATRGDIIKVMGGYLGGQGHVPSANLEIVRIDYARAIRRNQMLEDDYMGMVTSTLLYTMHERELMDELEKLRSPCKQWPHRQLLFTSWPPMDFMYPDRCLVNEQHNSSIDWNVRPKDELQYATMVSSPIVVHVAVLALLWPCVPAWIKDRSLWHMY